MKQYLATFHTHLAALKTHRTLQKQGVEARMAPVPRKISSSCGTCVFYRAENACESSIDADAEAIYQLDGETVITVAEFE